MSRGYHAQAITNPDIEALAKIRAWAAKQQNLNPAVDVVLEDLIEQLESYKKSGAIMRVRLKNKGRSPAEKAVLAEQERRKIAARQRIRQNDPETRTFASELWSAEDRILLRQLFDEGLDDTKIAERLGRTTAAVTRRRSNIGMLRPVRGGDNLTDEARQRGWKASSVANTHPAPRTPLQKARAVMEKRRQEEVKQRREGEAA